MLSMFAERKSVNEVRVRLNVVKGSDEADLVSWDGVRFDEFIVTDQEAERLGVPTPTFGAGVAFEPKFKSGIDYAGAVSTLGGLSDGPKVMAHPLFRGFSEFAQWVLRGAFSNEMLAEVQDWSMHTCGDHLHLTCMHDNGDVDHFSEKIGFKVYDQLSDEEKAGADEVAETIVDDLFTDEDMGVFADFLETVMGDPDDDEKENYRWN